MRRILLYITLFGKPFVFTGTTILATCLPIQYTHDDIFINQYSPETEKKNTISGIISRLYKVIILLYIDSTFI